MKTNLVKIKSLINNNFTKVKTNLKDLKTLNKNKK